MGAFKFLQKLLCCIVILICCKSHSQKEQKFGGIEIGSKGIKISIIEIENVKRGTYKLIDFWTENIGIARNISIDGSLALADINNATAVVAKSYIKLREEFSLDASKIFVVASSGVGMADNTNILIDKIKVAINKELVFISSKLESKLLFKGCVPPKLFSEALLIDIGGGNTKGGYAEILNDNMVFFPINMDLGTVTLTEKINKRARNSNLDQFLDANFDHQPELTSAVQQMILQKPLVNSKQKIYLTGGAVWSFFTLFYNVPPENMNIIKLDDIREFNAQLQNNFGKFTRLAAENTEADAVLKTYSQKSLIAANSILLTTVENIQNVNKKNVYFAKNGYLAWLIAYINDASKGVRVIY